MAPHKGRKGTGPAPKASVPGETHVPDGYVQLPHNMGLVKLASAQTGETTGSASDHQVAAMPSHRYALRSRKTPTSDQEQDQLYASASTVEGKGLKSRSLSSGSGDLADSHTHLTERPAKRQRTKEGDLSIEADQVLQPSQDAQLIAIRKKRVPRKGQSYRAYAGVPWGETPWPDLNRPSAADCEEVYAILSAQHADGNLKYERPAKIPPPSLEIAGCGETQLILDGLIRTILSGATTMKNANSAIQSVANFYGTVTKSVVIDGTKITPVKDSIDWNKVRLLGVDEFKRRIRSGGLQEINSQAIIANLEEIYAWNAERIAAFKQEKAVGIPAAITGAERLTQSQKDMEIWMFENGVISLEHLRGLSAQEVMHELVQLDKVAVKTAACVILFSLQEPCFAVDTHCFRMAQWLGWLPQDLNDKSGRHKAFAHLDLRIPDHFKYGLHQLFIEHGQNCNRCKAGTIEGTKNWGLCNCPLEHLLERKKQMKDESSNKRKSREMEDGSEQITEQTDDRSLDESEQAEVILNPGLQGDAVKEEEEEEEYTPTKRPGISKKRAPPVRRPSRQRKSADTEALQQKLDDSIDGDIDEPVQGV